MNKKALALVVMLSSTATGTLSDPAFVEEPFAKLETMITGLAWAPDDSGRLFLIRQTGEIRVVENGVVLPSPFATLDPLYASTECGLNGIAFDPEFAQNGYVYVYVAVSSTEQHIVRYTANGNVGTDKTSVVTGIPASGPYHCGGGLGFGRDGLLYWSTGDFGKYIGVDDDLSSLGAKVGRARPDGTAPEDNPFFDGAGPNNDFIWARGFRNPFALAFEPKTGRPWLNVAGTLYEQVFVPSAGDNAGWDDYENNQPAGYLAPTIAYRTGQADVRVIASVARAANVATFTTTVAHGFRPGTKLTIAGVADASFNGDAFVGSVPSDTEFSLSLPGPDATSSGGNATTLDIGNAITGGAFWDSSGVPADYRGNYLFGDYVSGNVVRAILDDGGTPSAVDIWGTLELPTDMALGPDGALYVASYGDAVSGGTVTRLRHVAPAQALVVSPLHVNMLENGRTPFFVRLATAPAQGSVTVDVARESGDEDVALEGSSALSFDANNWQTPQPVWVLAAPDPDDVDDTATLVLTSSGLSSKKVDVFVADDDPVAFVVSPAAVTLDEGTTGELAISLSAAPKGIVSVNVSRSSGDSDVSASGGALTFDSSDWATPKTVQVVAADDEDLVDDTAELAISAASIPERKVAVTVIDDDAPGGDAGTGGGAGQGGQGGATSQDSTENDGCGCKMVGVSGGGNSLGALLLALLLGWRRRARG